jgi:hypothetical protein
MFGARLSLLCFVVGSAACAPGFVPVRPSEPLAAATTDVRATVDGVWLTRDLIDSGMGDERGFAIQLTFTNTGTQPREVSPAAFACLMELDANRPGDTRSLLSVGGAEGAFPGEVPEGGSLLTSVVIPPGQTRTMWALFRGYEFPASGVPRRILVRIPIPGAPTLELAVADPARGNLRWQAPPARSAIAIGFRNTALFGRLTAQAVSTDITRMARAGRFVWEVGLTSTLFVQSRGPLVSETSSFVGSGLAARLTAPLLSWGTELEPRHLGVFAGGTASVLLEIADRPADEMNPPRIYGALMAEAGIELDVGGLRFAPSPFPLSPSGAALPRWMFRLGYTHASIGGTQSDGYMSSLRLTW